MLNILLVFTHTRRSVTQFAYKRAFKALGHNVVSVGPFDESQPWGIRSCRPDALLPNRQPWWYSWDEVMTAWRSTLRMDLINKAAPDVLILMAGGEDLRVTGVPIPWAHWCSEGSHMEWSETPHKFAEIMCNGADAATVQWMPKAFEYNVPVEMLSYVREYDIVQLASAREARRESWRQVSEQAPDLHCLFGDIWGPVYEAAYANALCTWVCSGHDFVTTRVFEAMALGCIVLADPQPSMRALFTPGEHYIEYEPVPGPGSEGMPDTGWLIDTVRKLRRDGSDIAARAHGKVIGAGHSYQNRAQRLLRAVKP